jgi:spore germination protein
MSREPERRLHMSRRIVVVLLALLAGRTTASLAQGSERLFYYVDREDSWNSLQKHIQQITIVAPSSYGVDEQGIVWGDVDPQVLALAKKHNVKVMPLLVNRPFNKDLLHQLLSSPVAGERAIASMVELSKRHDYWGMQVDFENVSIEDRDALTAWYQHAAIKMHQAGKTLSIAIVHRPEEVPGVSQYHAWMMADWRGGYDIKSLADAGDFVTVMTYSQHTRRTPPGPSASLPWTQEVVKYFLQFMPPQKLSLGISTGALHWYTSQEDRITPELARSYADGFSYNWAMHVAERNNAKWIWDDVQKMTYTYYPIAGTFEYIFLEDARNFAVKLDLVKREKLRGFSVWVLGPEDPAIWTVLGR